MTISARVIADSISPDKIRITTLQLRYPRFIHAEFMTHRVFSRNASSSRAVPVDRLIEDIIRDTAMPIHWGKNQPGMQAREDCDNPVIIGTGRVSGVIGFGSTEYNIVGTAQEAWCVARDRAIEMAREFNRAGYHKQIVNRLLEPFSHINVLVTSTEWENFFDLRMHRDAQPEIHELAMQMSIALVTSKPEHLSFGDWHLPYIRPEEKAEIAVWKEVGSPVQDVFIATKYDDLIKMSVARAARVSFMTHDGKEPNKEQDLKLYDRLVGSVPLHASPAEHVARPMTLEDDLADCRNFNGWVQHRSMLEHNLSLC